MFDRFLPSRKMAWLAAYETFERAPEIHMGAAQVCKWLLLPRGLDGKRSSGKKVVNMTLWAQDVTHLCALVTHWPYRLVESIAPEIDLSCKGSRFALAGKLHRPHLGLFDVVMEHLWPIAENVDTPQKLAGRGTSKNPKCNHLGLSAVRRLTGHALRVLQRQSMLGNIPDIVVNPDRRATEGRYEVDVKTFNKLKAFYAETNDIETSARMVGCSRSAMAGLVQSCCIAAGSICTDQSKTNFLRVSPQLLQAMTSKLFAMAQLETGSHEMRVYFSSWVTKHAHGAGQRHLRWRAVLSLTAKTTPLKPKRLTLRVPTWPSQVNMR